MENNKGSSKQQGEHSGKSQSPRESGDVMAAIKSELAAGRAPMLDDLKNIWGNKEVNKAIRDLAKDGAAGVHRRRLRAVDGDKYRFGEGVVEQRGPGRFLLVQADGSEAYLTAKSSKAVLSGDVVKCFLAQEPGEDAEALPAQLIRRDQNKIHIMRAKARQDGSAAFFIDNRVEEVLLDTRVEPVVGDIWECKIQESGLLRDVVPASAERRIGNEADKGIESSLAFLTRFPESSKVVEEQWATPFSLADSFDKAAREDVRELPFVTIDGKDSRDFDDAVACRDKPLHWLVSVGIADVSAFVGGDTGRGRQLDELAQKKMTSVYLPYQVHPMLPRQISNGICSLNPNEDRLALICDMEIEKKSGLVKAVRFYRGLMKSHARLTYESAQAFLDGQGLDASEAAKQSLSGLNDASKAMRAAGFASGRLDMGDDEVTFVMGDDGKIERLKSSPRLWTHKLVEECMLAANRAAAEHIDAAFGGGIFRNHVGVREDGLAQVHLTLETMGLKVGDGVSNITQAQISEALVEAKGIGKYAQARSAILGGMSSANYEAANQGHFSLVAPHYCHFTSPIRRYPDLMVHRIIKATIDCKPSPYTEAETQDLAKKASKFSQQASQAENESRKLLTLEYVRRRLIDQEVAASISTLGERGIWVGLPLDGASMEFFIPAKSLKECGSIWNDQEQGWKGPLGMLVEGEKIPCKIAKIDMGARRVELQPFPGVVPVAKPHGHKRP